MISLPQPKHFSLWHDLHHQVRPSTKDEALCRIAVALHQILGDIRVLFYLRTSPPHNNPLELLPCPARPLGPDVFVYEGAKAKSYFAFETNCFYSLPLMSNFHHFGYLFWESKDLPFTHSTLMLVAVLAGQIAHYLNDLGHLATSCPCQLDASVPLKLDPIHRRVWVAGELLPVSGKVFIFLDLLHQWYKQGQPCPRKLLHQAIYGDEVRLSGRRDTRLDSLVNRLRDKLDLVPGRPIQIETMYNTGYQLRLCHSPSVE